MSKFIVMIILKPDIPNGQIDFIESDLTSLFEQNATVKKVWFLGKRKLDYKIKKYTEGLYLKMEILAKQKKIEKIKENLRNNQNIIFSIIINNDQSQNNLPVLKKHSLSLPFTKLVSTNKIQENDTNKKVYMLVSKNVKLPFAESDIVATSEDVKHLYNYASKVLQELIYVKGYHCKKAFKFITELENELKRSWKLEFTLGNNANVMQQLLIKEKNLI